MPLDEAQAYLARVWQQDAALPRAIAALTADLAMEQAVAEALEVGERDEAAALQAERCALEDAFTAEYELPWGPARTLFERAMAFGVQHPAATPGEEVIHAPLALLFERLGYCDGRTGMLPPAAGPADLGPVPEAPASLSAAEASAVHERIGLTYRRAYELGYAYGWAEQLFAAEAPHIAAVIDDVLGACAAVGEDQLRVHTILESSEAVIAARLAPADAERYDFWVRAYRVARARSHRRITARLATMQAFLRQVPVTTLDVAALLRVLGRRLLDAEHDPAHGAEAHLARAYQEQMEEGIIMAAALGFTPDLVAACAHPAQMADYPMLHEAVEDHPRDLQRAAAVRRVLRAMAVAPRGSRALVEPIVGSACERVDPAGHQDTRVVHTLWTVDAVAPLVRAAMGEPASPAGIAAGRGYDLAATLWGDSVTPAATTADHPLAAFAPYWPDATARVMAGAILGTTAPSLPPGALPAVEVEAYLAREAAALPSEASPRPVPVALACALHAHVAVQEAEALLREYPAAVGWRVRAECVLAHRGDLLDAEAAEGWVGHYRREATALRDTGHGLAVGRGATTEADMREAAECLARARLLDAQLDVTARAEALRLLHEYIPSLDYSAYGAPGVEAQVREACIAALVRAQGMLVRVDRRAPRFGIRMRRTLVMVALEWLETELEVARVARAALDAPDVAGPL